MNFKQKVYHLVKKIPKGKVSTYKEISQQLEKQSPRAVGQALKQNKNYEKIPCHRVIYSDGSVGQYNRGQKKKIKLLKKEGIKIKDKKVNLKKYLFTF